MSWHPTLTELRTVLATLYPTIDDARRVVTDAGLDPLRIAFDAKAITNWQHILEEAHKANQVAALLAVAQAEYPTTPSLTQVIAAYQAAHGAAGSAENPTAPQASTTITQIETAGGMALTGNVTVGQGDVIGRDKVIQGDEVRGDKIINIYVTAPNQPTAPATPLTSPAIDYQPFEPATMLIPAGPCWLGSDDDTPAETPRRMVELAAYHISQYPITNTEYAEFLRHNPKQPEPPKAGWFLRKAPKGKERHPVVGVSWHDARAYCAWLSLATGRTYRLPSEAEWEKAARGADGRRYPWGDAWRDDCANVGSSATTPVDHFPAGASPYGCFDLLGNVQEWTSTPWDAADSASGYVLRGGSFRSQPAAVRCSARLALHPDSKVVWRGFRVVLIR